MNTNHRNQLVPVFSLVMTTYELWLIIRYILLPTNIINAKVCKCACLLLFHLKTTERIWSKFGAQIV